MSIRALKVSSFLLALALFYSSSACERGSASSGKLRANINKIERQVVLVQTLLDDGGESYRTGLVVGSESGHSFVLTVTAAQPGIDGKRVAVLTYPDFNVPHTARLIQRDAWSPEIRASWFTTNLELWDVVGISIEPVALGQGDVGSRTVAIIGYAQSSIALWKLETDVLEPKVVESNIAGHRDWRGDVELFAEPGFSNGGAVAFDEDSGSVIAILGAIPVLDDGTIYDGHSVEAIDAFLARRHIKVPHHTLGTVAESARATQASSTFCLQEAAETSVPWDHDRKVKAAAGIAVVVASDSARSYLLTLTGKDSLRNVGTVTLPRADSPLFPFSIVGTDTKTGMALLAIDEGSVPPVTIATNVSAPTDVDTLILGESKSALLPCSEQPAAFQPGIVSAIHDGGQSLEQTTGIWGAFQGSPIFDERSGSLVGLVMQPVRETNEDFQAVGSTAIRAFLSSLGIHVTSSSGGDSVLVPRGLQQVPASVVRIKDGVHVGSGTVIGLSGGSSIVLTASHVVEREPVQVFVGGETSPHLASILKRDADSDLLLLRIDGTSAKPIPVASRIDIGDVVAIAGYPKSSYDNFSAHDPPLRLSEGIVSSLYSSAGIFTQTAATDPGNSGGPVFDPLSGCLYGIVAGEVPNSGLPFAELGSSKAYYAITADRVWAFIKNSMAPEQSSPVNRC